LGYPLVTFGVAEKKKSPSKMVKLGLEELAWVYSETAAPPMQFGLMFGPQYLKLKISALSGLTPI
jgi:hypothetical protein